MGRSYRQLVTGTRDETYYCKSDTAEFGRGQGCVEPREGGGGTRPDPILHAVSVRPVWSVLPRVPSSTWSTSKMFGAAEEAHVSTGITNRDGKLSCRPDPTRDRGGPKEGSTHSLWGLFLFLSQRLRYSTPAPSAPRMWGPSSDLGRHWCVRGLPPGPSPLPPPTRTRTPPGSLPRPPRPSAPTVPGSHPFGPQVLEVMVA